MIFLADCRYYRQETAPTRGFKTLGDARTRQLQRCEQFYTYKVTQACRDPICGSLRVFQCHLEPSWTPWQSGVVQHYSSSSCGQEPLTPQQTEGNEKRVPQPMASYFICRETWLILQLCGHCLWMQTIWHQNVGQARKEASEVVAAETMRELSL